MIVRFALPATVALALTAAPALASTPDSGGAAAPSRAAVVAARCADGEDWSCQTRSQLTLKGDGLDAVDRVVFRGRHGAHDRRRARPLRASAHELVVVVPAGTRSGPLFVHSTVSGVSRAPRSLRITRVAAAPAEAPSPEGAPAPAQDLPADLTDGVFPIRGKHDLGQSAANRFGGARRHQGQDVFAACGTPLAAVRDAKVQFAGSQSRAGNYLVLQDDSGQSYAYMHMRSRPLVATGDTVSAGEPVGYVGDTGDAVGCHLHFELWTAPGWYTGGHPVDPLPQLKRWESADSGHR